MKTHLNKNRVLAYLRASAGCAFFAAAAALAFVATTTNVLTTPEGASTKTRLTMMKSSVQDSLTGAARERSEKDGSFQGPLTRAEEEAAKRAYPANETPFTAQLNAVASFSRFVATSGVNATPTPTPKGKVGKKNKKQPPENPPRFNTWQLIGPSTAPIPSILTFSGAPSTFSGRITALALDTHNGCTATFCRLWIGAAGGGVWRTTNALSSNPTWTFLTSLNVVSNAIGALTYFDNGTANGILYAGTGEPNASADSEAGLGLMKSINGGDTWTQVAASIGPITTNSAGTGSNGTYTGNAFYGRAISKIVVDPTNANIIYVSSARSVRGIDETYGGPTSNPPVPRPPFGLFKSTDGGAHFTYIFDGDPSCGAGTCLGGGAASSIRGVTDLALDPSNHNIVYAADFPGPGGGGGVWRSSDGGSTWTQIKTTISAGGPIPFYNIDRCSFSVTTLPGPNTRMYVGCGNDGTNTATVFRSDLVQTGAPVFTNLNALQTYEAIDNYCGGQCWYDNVIYTPPGFPDVVYVGGSYTYNECAHGSNCRGVVFATDAGAGNFWNDATWDAQNFGPNPGSCCNPNAVTPNQMHPDHHFLVTVPGNPFLFFDGSDGGMVRSNGTLTDTSGQCASRTYPAGTGTLAQCQLLTGLGFPCTPACGIPTQFTNMNAGLATLQFMSLSVAANNYQLVQGGTQDNGTFAAPVPFSLTWSQEIYGDGGQSGFNVSNSAVRFNTFTGQANDGNFRNGDPSYWVEISGPILFSPEGSLFYPSVIADPHPSAAGSIFQPSWHVWRTQDWGGSQAFLEANCPEFGAYSPACGDFVPLGGTSGANDQGCLICSFWGSRSGGNINVLQRTTSNTSTEWAGTTTGRVFISNNVNNNPASSVLWSRLDPVGATDPQRVVTGVAIDPINTNHAWVSYSGYNFNTPSQPGHIFSVSWSGAGSATWTNISNNLPDIPLTSVVYDPVTGDLYVSCDFTVFRLAAGHTVWDVAGMGLPIVEVPHLTINPGARWLYAATHGLSAWALPLY